MSEILELDPQGINVESGLYDDWGLDSLQAFELIIMSEQLAGLAVPPAEIPDMYSAGDAYGYYQRCLSEARLADG
jgi:acyl carrier protein